MESWDTLLVSNPETQTILKAARKLIKDFDRFGPQDTGFYENLTALTLACLHPVEGEAVKPHE